MSNTQDKIDYRHSGGDTWEIVDIAVMSNRRKGIGTKLVKTAIKDIKKSGGKRLYAITRYSNKVAQDFYKSLGMNAIDLPDFYPDENAIMFIKRI